MFWDTDTRQSSSRIILIYGLCLLFCGVFFSLFGLHTEARAGTVSFSYDQSFGATPPDGPIPYATAVFDDGGIPGTVTLTIEVAATVGEADVAAFYFNISPTLNPNSLSFVRTGGDGPVASDINVLTGVDAFMANGDGMYDILIDLPVPPGPNARRFNGGEELVLSITRVPPDLVASDFDFVSAPPPGPGGAGPFFSVARFLSTGSGPQFNDSDWVGAIPEPSTLVLLGLGSLALVVRRRGART